MNVKLGVLEALLIALSLYTGVQAVLGLVNEFDHNILLVLLLISLLITYVTLHFTTRRKHKKDVQQLIESCHAFNKSVQDIKLKFEDNDGEMTKNYKHCRSEVVQFTNDSLNHLSNALTAYTGKEICIHYKHIPFEENSGENGDTKIMTLALCHRTGQFGPDRHKVRKHNITDSVPYQELYNEMVRNLYYPDFRKHRDKYKELTDKEFIRQNDKVDKYYGSVAYSAVQKQMKDDSYDVRGILVADHPEPYAFLPSEKDREIVTELMETFADGLYMIMFKFSEAELLHNEK